MLFAIAAPLLLLAAAPARATDCEGTASYTLQYDMNWSGETHPIEYPSDLAKFTPFFTVTHNADISLWSFGETANNAVVLVAEGGDSTGVDTLAEECIEDNMCGELVAPMCEAEDESSQGVCVADVEIEVEAEYPYISSVAMVVPSPDWFTGVDSVNLCKDGKWLDSLDYPLYPLDAGSDSGLTFLSPDLDTQPRAPIANFADIMPSDLGHFYNPSEGRTLPLGRLLVTRN